jgi:SsrA-binding protein
VKSARTGKIQLQDAFAEIDSGEAWLTNAHFSPYSHGNRYNHDVMRRRKLLLHRQEIDKLWVRTRDRGLTLVPTKVYLKDGLVKCEIALARGKKLHDKRETERKREQESEARMAAARRR